MRADPGFWRQASPSLGAHGTIRSVIVFSENPAARYRAEKWASIRKMADAGIFTRGTARHSLQP